jgi:hypothetical protein
LQHPPSCVSDAQLEAFVCVEVSKSAWNCFKFCVDCVHCDICNLQRLACLGFIACVHNHRSGRSPFTWVFAGTFYSLGKM